MFRRALDDRAVDPSGREWVYVPYDQLTDQVGPLARLDPDGVGIVLVESSWKARRRPYHKQKLALLLSSMRQFALEQAERGVCVRYLGCDTPFRDALAPLAAELGPLRMMRAAERELRVDLAPLVDEGAIVVERHAGWLSTEDDFVRAAKKAPPFRMDSFYREVRRRTGVLMDERGKPIGGRFSFDGENRKPYKGEVPLPDPPRFDPDDVTLEVADVIDGLGERPGQLQLDRVPASLDDVEAMWAWAKGECLPHFGPFEDAMTTRSGQLFHTRIAGLLNLGRLLPQRILDDVLALDLPLSSQEGFVRQILGWREFMRHVHERTDGFRRLPDGPPPVVEKPGDGGYARWRGEPFPASDPGALPELDGGAAPSALDADQPLPPAFWGTPSGLRCLDHVVGDVWREGWTHHIPRLMVLSNLATLLGVRPRELTDWFWVAYEDAYDWVVEPNVLGMGTFGVGELFTTKPYVSGAAYLDKMGDYCGDCAFHPKKTCPITSLYWTFLERNQDRLDGNPRVAMPLRSLQKRDDAKRARDRRVLRVVQQTLAQGEELTPAALAAEDAG